VFTSLVELCSLIIPVSSSHLLVAPQVGEPNCATPAGGENLLKKPSPAACR
jgi:hypothetical protein